MKDKRTILLENILIPNTLEDMNKTDRKEVEKFETLRTRLKEHTQEYYERTGQFYKLNIEDHRAYLK